MIILKKIILKKIILKKINEDTTKHMNLVFFATQKTLETLKIEKKNQAKNDKK
jgi:hypothetical protein